MLTASLSLNRLRLVRLLEAQSLSSPVGLQMEPLCLLVEW